MEHIHHWRRTRALDRGWRASLPHMPTITPVKAMDIAHRACVFILDIDISDARAQIHNSLHERNHARQHLMQLCNRNAKIHSNNGHTHTYTRARIVRPDLNVAQFLRLRSSSTSSRECVCFMFLSTITNCYVYACTYSSTHMHTSRTHVLVCMCVCERVVHYI